MKLVIDIPNGIYDTIQADEMISREQLAVLQMHIMNGTPLPKGHGRLKDEDEIVKAIEDRVNFLKENDAVFMRLRKDIDILGCIPKIRTEVSTIIEADKE